MTTAHGMPARGRLRLGRGRVVAVLAAALLVLTGCAGQDSQPSSSEAGGYVSGDGRISTWEPAERDEPVELTGTSYEKEEVDLADWRGEVVVVNFWYAACPPCRAEAPDLVDLSEEFEDQGVQFLGVNHTDGSGTALAFQRNFDIPYPSLHDRDADGVAAMEGVVPLQAMPSTVVLDRQGRVAARVIGQIQHSTLSALIEQTLAEEQ